MTRDGHTPLRKDSGQSVEEMAQQLAEAGGNRHWTAADPDSKSKISRIVNGGTMTISNPPPRVDLSNVEAVKAVARRYWQACAESGRVPTFAGLAAALGHSRRNLYRHMNAHSSDETSSFLQIFQTAAADVLMQAGLTNSVNTIMGIFLLKNSGQGLADRSELEVVSQPRSPLDDLNDEERAERLRQYIRYLPDITDDEGGDA